MNGDGTLGPPGRDHALSKPRRSSAEWWTDTAAPVATSDAAVGPAPRAPQAAVDPVPTDVLRAGALIVGLERRRARTRAGWRSSALLALPALVVVALGGVAFAIDGAEGHVSTPSLLSAAVGLFGFLFVVNRHFDDDAGIECTPAELGDLVGYVAGQENGDWTVTDRGEAAKAAYLALDPQDQR